MNPPTREGEPPCSAQSSLDITQRMPNSKKVAIPDEMTSFFFDGPTKLLEPNGSIFNTGHHKHTASTGAKLQFVATWRFSLVYSDSIAFPELAASNRSNWTLVGRASEIDSFASDNLNNRNLSRLILISAG